MSLKDIDTGIKKIKSMLISDIERQLKLLGIGYEKIYSFEEINDVFDINRKYKRKQILDVLINECEESEIGLLLTDAKIREKNLRKFIRECSFNLLNKLCAIRLLEERNMIVPTIKKFKEYGDKSEVQKNLVQVSYDLMDRDPYDGMKYAIESTLRELSTQIKVMFDVNSEHSLLFPDPKTLKDIIKVLIDEIPEEDWKRDDFIGWAYQYFVEDEKEEIEQADTPEEIAAKTQVYTYDWVVKYIVDNTLGTYWNEIKSGKRPQQSVETIKLIDPACGSGSFLVYAFDKFYEIYKEEGKVPEKDIPNYIISKNLYGLDIDERAVQLTALNLYIKAKETNRNVQIDKFNIICTDSRIKQDVNIDKYLISLPIDPKLREVIKNIVQQVFNYMKENNVLGSLMKIEEVINPIIDEYIGGRRRLSIREVKAKEEKNRVNGYQMSLFSSEVEQLSFDTFDRYFESREEFVDYLRQKILDCVDYVVTKINKDNDINSRMFAKDLNKGSNFIGAMMQKYEIVVGNPPYLGNKKTGKEIVKLLKKNYDFAVRDLYSCFFVKDINLVKENGLLGIITPNSYITVGSFEKLRKYILKNTTISKCVMLGKDTFNEVAVDVCIMICIKGMKNQKSLFLELEKSKDKEIDLLNENGIKYLTMQSSFNKIPTTKFVYWLSEDFINILSLKRLEGNYALVKDGVGTGDNNKFVFMRWEIKNKNQVWVPYAKGGGYNKYLGRNDYLIYWKDDGKELKEFAKKKYGSVTRKIINQDFYFKEGISYSRIVSNNLFSARYMPKGWIFDAGGPAVFNVSSNLKYLLGYLNSKLINYILTAFNPTVNFQPGDVKMLPYKETEDYSSIVHYVNGIMILKIYLYKFDVLSELFTDASYIDFITSKNSSIESIENIFKNYFYFINNVLICIEELQYFIDEYMFALYGISQKGKEDIFGRFNQSCIKYPIVNDFIYDISKNIYNYDTEDISLVTSSEENVEQVEEGFYYSIDSIRKYYSNQLRIFDSQLLHSDKIEFTSDEIKSLINNIRKLACSSNYNILKISQELKINPRSILAIMEKYNIYIYSDKIEFTKRYLQTLARKAFDEDKDGIVLLPDMLDTIHDELSKTFTDRASSIETEINNIIGKDIEKWLLDEYATDYVNNTGYDKKNDTYKEIKNPWEPLVWKGQSPKKNFTVFVWRYKITPDTELKIRSQYLENEIENYKKRIKEIDSRLVTADDKEKKRLEKERDEILNIVDDLNDFHKWISDNGIKLRGMWFNLE